MAKTDRDLVAHLMRRAGFGATNDELDELVNVSYEELVDGLLHPERFPEVDDTLLRRYYLELNNPDTHGTWQAHWIYRMVNTRRPLQEKIALFWHHVFATSIGKSEHTPSGVAQIETFRRNGLSDLRTIYIDLARDPAMLFWLDNCENHSGEPNENWGRELLELFSMGVGQLHGAGHKGGVEGVHRVDFRAAAAARPVLQVPVRVPLHAGRPRRRREDFPRPHRPVRRRGHHRHRRRPACDGGVSYRRHLYNFFVADEPQVPAWNIVPPQDPDAIEIARTDMP